MNGFTTQFRLVQPYLDNPPLAGVIFAAFDSNRSISTTSIGAGRLVSIVFSLLGLLAIFLLVKNYAGLWSAVLTASIYAVGPGFVFASRMAVPENIIAAFFPWAIWLTSLYITHSKRLTLFLILVLAFFAPLLKVSGLIIPLTICAILLYERRYKVVIYVVSAAISALLLYGVYCWYYNPELFLRVLNHQGERTFYGPITMLLKFLQPRFPAPFFDGWVVLGYLGLLAIPLVDNNNAKVLLRYVELALVSFILFFTLYGGDLFLWYQFIILPLVALVAGVLVAYYFAQPNILFNLFFYIVVFSSFYFYKYYGQDWQPFLPIYRLFTISIIALPTAAWLFLRKSVLLRVSLLVMILLSLWFSIGVINQAQHLWPLFIERGLLVIQ